MPCDEFVEHVEKLQKHEDALGVITVKVDKLDEIANRMDKNFASIKNMAIGALAVYILNTFGLQKLITLVAHSLFGL